MDINIGCDSPYPLEKCITNSGRRSVYDRLQDQKRDLEKRLSAVNEAITALEDNPQVTKVLELLSKV